MTRHALLLSDVYFPRVNGVSTSLQTFRVDLRGTRGRYTAEWFSPDSGVTVRRRGTIRAGARREVTPPFQGPAVLFLRKVH